MENKIKDFFIANNIIIDIDKSIISYQTTTYYCRLQDYNTSTINKILKLQNILCLYLQINNVLIDFDYSNGYLLIQIENKERKTFTYTELIKNYKKENENGLYINIGSDTNNNIKNINLCDTPHLLIAGSTGSGKSVLMNDIILQLIEKYNISDIELVLIDIKQVEFSIYEDIPHLLYNPITTLSDTRQVLENTINDMTKRYEILKDNKCRNITEYNNKNDVKMKYKVIIIDELAELLMLEQNKLKSNLEGYDTIEKYICRIAQLGRASGIHLILATQRPSSDIISGLIKNNIPSRIALSVPSMINSKIILDQKGAENLSGKGDLLLKLVGNNNLERLQAAYITEQELQERLNNIKSKYTKTNKIELVKRKERKAEIIKELENTINKLFTKSESKNTIYNTLMKNENIELIINDITEEEIEQEYLRNNYFEILNKVKRFYNGYITEEKEQIKELKKQEKIRRRDNIITLQLIARGLRNINKKI